MINTDEGMIDCPCGCKDLNTEDMLKRHLTILGVAVFIISLGMVGLNAYQKELKANTSVQETSIATSHFDPGPGAIQAAEIHHHGSMTAIQHPAHSPQVYNPYYAQQYTHHAPSVSSRANLIRHEAPTLTTVHVFDREGKARLKRIVNR